jgi:mycothiol synthase
MAPRLRPPTPVDEKAVYALLAARDRADYGVVDFQPADIHKEWNAPGFELSRDAVVAELTDGTLAGYAIVRHLGSLVAVHPEYEAPESNAALLEWCEARERELRRPQHRQMIASSNSPAAELLRRNGYAHVRSYYRMERRLDNLEDPVPSPVGVTLRQLDVERDARALHALDDRAFASASDYTPESVELFCSEHLGSHDFDPTLSLTAWREERLVGFLVTRRWESEGTGFVDILAVDPGQQGGGIGTALMGCAFTNYARAGLQSATLGVSLDNPRALALYERLGMTPRFRSDIYERPTSS